MGYIVCSKDWATIMLIACVLYNHFLEYHAIKSSCMYNIASRFKTQTQMLNILHIQISKLSANSYNNGLYTGYIHFANQITLFNPVTNTRIHEFGSCIIGSNHALPNHNQNQCFFIINQIPLNNIQAFFIINQTPQNNIQATFIINHSP